MSRALPFAGAGQLTASPVESSAFGFGVARLTVGGGWRQDVATAAELADRVETSLVQAEEDLVIVRFPTEVLELACLDPRGRKMLHAGTLLYWEDPNTEDIPIPAGLEADVIRGGAEAPTEFVRAATAVVADSFDGYLNHYSYSARIPAAVARDGYVDWARRTIADPAGVAILLHEREVPIASATLRLYDDGSAIIADVELASVSSDRQGAGRYRDLWAVVRRTARGAGAVRLIISTQTSNLRVQRAWARLGLVPLASFDTVHAVADAPEF